VVNEFLALLVCAAFAFPVKLSLSQSMSFCTFTLLICSPILLQGSEQAAALAAYWG